MTNVSNIDDRFSLVGQNHKRKMLLTIELVPSTCHFNNVRSHTTETEWSQLRKTVLQKANHECEVCGRKNGRLQCHEVWSYDLESIVQKLEKFLALCMPCHAVKHFAYWQKFGRTATMKDHLADVNLWTDEQVEEHIAASFDLCLQRSKQTWNLNIETLELYGLKVDPTAKEEDVSDAH